MKKVFGSSATLKIVLDGARAVSKDGKGGLVDRIEIPASSKSRNQTDDFGISDFASSSASCVKGRVILSLSKPLTRATDLSVRLWGSLEIDASGVMHWVSPEITDVRAVNKTLVDTTTVLWRKSTPNTSLDSLSSASSATGGSFEAGEHEFPFTLYLPGDAPPSVSIPYGNIQYYLRARLSRLGLSSDVTSSTKPLIVARTSIYSGNLLEHAFETRFHKIKVHMLEEIPSSEPAVKVSVDVTVIDRDAIGCLAGVKLLFVERRSYSCGIPHKSLMYKEESNLGKGCKYTLDKSQKGGPALAPNLSNQQLHAAENFPLAASALPTAMPGPLRITMKVPLEGANVSIRTHDLRITHRLVVRLDMDTEVWGGDRHFTIEIPSSIVAVSHTSPLNKTLAKGSSYAASLAGSVGPSFNGSCAASIRSGCSASSGAGTEEKGGKDGFGIMIPGHSISRAASIENLRGNGQATVMAYTHIDRHNLDERADALLDKSNDGLSDMERSSDFAVGSPSNCLGRSMISSASPPPEELSWVNGAHLQTGSPTPSIKGSFRPTDFSDAQSRSRSTSGASGKWNGHVQLPLTPESLDIPVPAAKGDPGNFMLVTPPTPRSPALHPSRSMPYLNGVEKHEGEEKVEAEGRNRSASANEAINHQAYAFLSVDPAEMNLTPFLQGSESSDASLSHRGAYHHGNYPARQPHVRPRSRSGSSTASSNQLFRGYGAPTPSPSASPVPPSSPSLSDISDSAASANHQPHHPEKAIKPSMFKIPLMKSLSNLLSSSTASSESGSMTNLSYSLSSESGTPSVPFNTTASSRRLNEQAKRSISPHPPMSGRSLDDLPPRRSIDSQRSMHKATVTKSEHPLKTSVMPPRRSVDEKRGNSSPTPLRKSLDLRPSLESLRPLGKKAAAGGGFFRNAKVPAQQPTAAVTSVQKQIAADEPAIIAVQNQSQAGDAEWELVDGVYEFVD
ncbi:hypothetical protein HDU67_006467 [Dinochytrium kinnereticum]|nr:hypothetical protein HDU67_006467 [Dinochytrium kinnereticum]